RGAAARRASLLPAAQGVRRCAWRARPSQRRGSEARDGQVAPRAAAARVDVAREAGTGSAGARLRASRGAAVHRQGHPTVAEAPTGQHDGPPWTLTQTAPSSLARSDVSRARFAESSCAV